MPTGYTAGIADGKIKNRSDYLMSCARAFGALIHMREDSLDCKIKKAVPSDYYKRQLSLTQNKLDELINADDNGIQSMIDKTYNRELKSNKEYYQKGKIENDRYVKMLSEVKEWLPPTEEHVGLKEFAIEQIITSMSDYYKKYKDKIPNKLTIKEYRRNNTELLLEDIEYWSKHNSEEIDRCNKRNEWVNQLKESLF